MSAHTSAWSERRSPDICIDALTCAIRLARPAAYCVRGAALNALDRARHRPASTHDTGMVSVVFAGTRIVRLTTRFCLAPRSSSPSRMKTGFAPLFMTRNSGTLPCSRLSVISVQPCRERLVQREVERLLLHGRGTDEREHGDVRKDDGVAEGDLFECVRDRIIHASIVLSEP